MRMTRPGLPAVSVPVGFNASGLPMGMQLTGRPQADPAVLRIARAHEVRAHAISRAGRRPCTRPERVRVTGQRLQQLRESPLFPGAGPDMLLLNFPTQPHHCP